jgi:mono/diheme cytochrome c family protein
MKRCVIAGLAAACAIAAHAEAPTGDAARGQALFEKNMCWTCHGTAGQGTRYGLRLAPKTLPWEAFAQQVRHPRAAMPRYPSEFVSDAELADIVAYLSSVKAGPKADDIPLLKE